MRTRTLAAVAAASVLVFAACGDDDEGASSDETEVIGPAASADAVADVTDAVADVTTPGAATTEAGAAMTTESGLAGAVTSEAGAGAMTTEAGAGAMTTEAGAATTEAGAMTTEAGAVMTTEAGVTPAGAATTEAGAAMTTEAAADTTEAGADTTEAAPGSTDAGAGATSEPASASSVPGGAVPPGEGGEITIGSADFYESELLGQIYGQALEAAGFDVSYEAAIGPREVYLGAIEAGEVDLIPEYTGSLLAFVLAPDQPDAANVDEQVAALGEALPEGLEVLTPSSAEDKDTIVCTQDAVDEFELTDLSSLFESSAEITIGAKPEFETRSPFGLEGFRENNGAEFEEFVPLQPADIVAALSAGEIDCGNIFSTDPAIATEGFVVIEDDLTLVPNEAVLPLVRSDVVTPELVAVLDAVNAELDTETLTELGGRVVNEQLGVDVVAEEYLATLDQ